MFGWFKRSPKPKRKLQLTRINVVVLTDDGVEHTYEFKSEYMGPRFNGRGDWIVPASQYFDSWRERMTSMGSFLLDDGKYMPTHRIREINTTKDTFEIEVE